MPTSRATSSMSPAAHMWSIAASGWPSVAPDRRSAVGHLDGLGLEPVELRQGRLAEEVVVAVPLPVMIERDDEKVRLLERLESPR